MTAAIAIALAGVLLSVGLALIAAARVSGKVEARVATNERDIERLRIEKASTERVDGLKSWLDEKFSNLESLIRSRQREESGAYRVAPGGE